jgi:hypothetical protein
LLAYYLDCARLYAYGLLFALPVPCQIILKKFFGVNVITMTLAVSAAVMIFIGTLLLNRFLRDHPVPDREVSNGQ